MALKILPRPTVIGLKTSGVVDDEFDHIFDDSEDDGDFQTTSKMRLNLLASKTIHKINKGKQIKSYSDIANNVAALSSSLATYQDTDYGGKLKFTSEPQLQSSYHIALNEFYMGKKSDLFEEWAESTDQSSLPTTVQVQIKIVRFTYKKDIKFNDFDTQLTNDSQLLALLYFLMTNQCTNASEACSNIMNSALEYVKSPTKIPISVFFPDFTLDNIIFLIAKNIWAMFPKHPIIPSVIEKLSSFVQNSRLIMDIMSENNQSSSSPNLDDDDSFDDLPIMLNRRQDTQAFFNLNDNALTNPLDFTTTYPVDVKILPEAPFPFVYKIPHMMPDDYSEWILSNRQTKLQNQSPTSINFSLIPSSDISQYELYNVTKTMLESEVRHFIPDKLKKNLHGTLIPIIHFLNINSKEPYTSVLSNIDIFKQEWEIQGCISNKNSKQIEFIVKQMSEGLDQIKQVKIAALPKKRKMPPITCQISNSTITLMKLLDLSLISKSLSPLSFTPFSLAPIKIGFSSTWLAESIFKIYYKSELPAYLCFRTCYVLSLLLSDNSPNLASDIINEGLYILLKTFPHFKSTVWSCYGFLLLAINLNQIDRYYFSAQAMDNGITLFEKDPFISSNYASIALQKNDYVRAMYYYTIALKLFINDKQNDEAIYTGKLLANMYYDANRTKEAIQTLLYVLNQIGELESINSITAAVLLTKLYIKTRQFNAALSLLDKVKNQSTIVKNLVNLVRAKIHFSRNSFSDFYKYIKLIENTMNMRRSSFMSQSDTLFPSIIVTIKANLKRCNFSTALFWTEILCGYAKSLNQLKFVSIGFYIRGKILGTLLMTCNCSVFDFTNSPLDEWSTSYGSFDPNRKVTRQELLTEALSSFIIAMNWFDNSGNTQKLMESKLSYMELILTTLLVHKYIVKKEIGEIVCKSPIPFITVKFDIPFDETVISGLDTILTIAKGIDQIARSSLYPEYVVRSQIINAYAFFLQGKTESAQTLIDYAFLNIRKTFFNGTRFIGEMIKITYLAQISLAIKEILLLIMMFDSNFINEHLIIFDMLNEILTIIKLKSKTVVENLQYDYKPTIELNSAAINAMTKNTFPECEVQFVDESETDDPEFLQYYRCIERMKSIMKSKLPDKTKQQINEEELKLIFKIVNAPEQTKIPIPTNTLFVFKIYNNFLVYMPETKSKHFQPITEELFNETYVKSLCDLYYHNGSINQDFLKQSYLIGKSIFGKTSNLKKYVVQPIPDNHTLGKQNSFEIGTLASLNVPHDPLTVVIDTNLQYLPFEYYLPSICIIRAFQITTAKKRLNQPDIPTGIVLNYHYSQPFDQVYINRTKDLVDKIKSSLGYNFSSDMVINDYERTASFPCPLINPSQPPQFCLSEFPFSTMIPCKFGDVCPDLSTFANILFVFTLNDLAAWPLIVHNLYNELPRACFLFIPIQVYKPAMKIIEALFERHQIRKAYFKNNPTDKKAKNHMFVIRRSYQFMATLQYTLTKRFKLIFPMFAPSGGK